MEIVGFWPNMAAQLSLFGLQPMCLFVPYCVGRSPIYPLPLLCWDLSHLFLCVCAAQRGISLTLSAVFLLYVSALFLFVVCRVTVRVVEVGSILGGNWSECCPVVADLWVAWE